MTLLYKLLLLTAGTTAAHCAWAQAPVLQEMLPRANAVAVPRTGSVQLTFSQPMSAQAASPDAVRVTSLWRSQVPGTFQGAGTSTLTFTPTKPFMAGEPLRVSVSERATSTAGTGLVAGVVTGFTAATSPSSGRFLDEDVDVGLQPRCMAVADLNHDGNPDFVVGSPAKPMLAVRLGDGQGGFLPPAAAATTSSGVNSPLDLQVADMNSDGHPDILTIDQTYSYVSLAFGDGSGQFNNPSAGRFIVENNMRGLAVADFNADGKLDFAVGLSRLSAVAIRLGDGKGTFSTLPNISCGPAPAGLAAADVNHDGRPDLVVLNSNLTVNTATVLLGNGAGGFTALAAVPVAAGATDVALNDINADGHLDALVVCATAKVVSVLLGDGTGSLKAPAVPEIKVGTSPQAIAVADINSDGRPDFAVSNSSSSSFTVSLRLGDGAGGFQPAPVPEYPTGLGPYAIALTDVNRDSQPDLLAGNAGVAYASTSVSYLSVSVRLGDGAGRFVVPAMPRVALEKYVTKMALGDLNNDGLLDMLSVNFSGFACVRLGAGQGRFVAPATPNASLVTGVGQFLACLALGDLNNDGNLDFITNNSVNGSQQLAIYFGNGQGGFTRQSATEPVVPIGFDPMDMVLTDLTGDGNLDLLTCSRKNGTVSVRIGNGRGGFTAPALPEVQVGNAPMSVATGDFNGDGKMDFATANYESLMNGSVSIRLGDGRGGFTKPTVAEVILGENQPNDIALGDLNNDGNLDFATCNVEGLNAAGNNISIRLGDGKGGFTAPAVPETKVRPDPTGIALGDVNGDGNLDALVSEEYASRLSVRFGDGKGGLTVPKNGADINVGRQPSDALLGDVDNDGDLDLVVPNAAEISVSVRLNDRFTGSVLPVKPSVPVATESRLRLYPNPASAHEQVQVEGAASATLQLLDLTGRLIRTQPARQALRTQGLTPGIYLVRAGSLVSRLEIR
ncbi:FG-GAP-like repeat-containing protein [Hymenobacter pini]|uniref:FG-GAP-like repeat-containing protein n=1 Tax=Hymenobacter pini TaxID=2880879 RepID=UPI001CF2ABFF|nr:FG-GAP-like repeat-containing protein [Hymenobacter pini]MCA8829581.1 FG-GAP-like repeat-containing protein [Hymenobacter pini]